MTKEENLNKIRAACEVANLEILQRRRVRKVDPQFEGTDLGVEEIIAPPIGLADVLLTIEESPELFKINRNVLFIRILHSDDWCHWNLCLPLDEQDEATLSFIAGLL